MNIHIDGIIFSLQKSGGISVYFRELMRHLSESHVPFNLTIEQPAEQIFSDIPMRNIAHSRNARILERFRRCRPSDAASIFHSSYYRLPSCNNVPTVVTVHDFIHERFRSGLSKQLHTWQKYSAIRQAQAIICISQSTLDDLVKYVGIRSDQIIKVIHNGASNNFRPLSINYINSPFIIYVGNRKRYKNFKFLLKALHFLPDILLYCVGGGQFQKDELYGFPDSVINRIHYKEYTSESELNLLLNQAICFVSTSLMEGFGITVAEAMKAGCPVVAVNCKAVHEVAGDAIEIVYDDDPKSLANGIKGLYEPTRRMQRISSGLRRAKMYNWSLCHNETLNLYRDLSDSFL